MAVIPGLQDFYGPSAGKPNAFTLGDIGIERGNALEDYGVGRFKMQRDFNRGSSDLVDRFSARGTARSGILSKAAGRMREDYNFGVGDSDRLLRRNLADLDRQRLLATLGVLS
jgi:hypothetical protein